MLIEIYNHCLFQLEEGAERGFRKGRSSMYLGGAASGGKSQNLKTL